jgi:hypothetical protein
MNRVCTALCAGLLMAPAAQAANVGVDDSSAPWLGFMNVFELDGTSFVFDSPWGVPDLVASFDDAVPNVTMSPNTIGDPSDFWYQGGGGPGAPGNKVMEANLYQERRANDAGSLSGQSVTFSGYVTDYSLTAAHEAKVFIRDFAEDFSSDVSVFADIDDTGFFSISLDTISDGSNRAVQWGFQMKGVNVWVTDTDPFGSVTYSNIPAPAGLAALGMAGLVAARRRRG